MERKFKYLHNDEWVLTDFAIHVNGWELTLAEVQLDSFAAFSESCRIWLYYRGNRFVLDYPRTSFDVIGYIEQFATFTDTYLKEKAEARKARIRSVVLQVTLGIFLASLLVAGIGLMIGDLVMYYAFGFFVVVGILTIIVIIYVYGDAFKAACETSIKVEHSKKKNTYDDGTKDIVKGAVVGGVVAGGSGAIVGAIIALNKHLNKKK